ncbi:hypothetical protein TNCV_4194311 [Trichonephila clavipes]|nr:hypothetical protein TNCV_4194311 [Trichonephila clavipes]
MFLDTLSNGGILFSRRVPESMNRSASSAASVDFQEWLTNLITFLKTETEGEERINLVVAGFGLGSSEKKKRVDI